MPLFSERDVHFFFCWCLDGSISLTPSTTIDSVLARRTGVYHVQHNYTSSSSIEPHVHHLALIVDSRC